MLRLVVLVIYCKLQAFACGSIESPDTCMEMVYDTTRYVVSIDSFKYNTYMEEGVCFIQVDTLK